MYSDIGMKISLLYLSRFSGIYFSIWNLRSFHISLKKKKKKGVPWWSNGKDSVLSIPGQRTEIPQAAAEEKSVGLNVIPKEVHANFKMFMEKIS